MTILGMLKRPSAFLPLTMSCMALAVVLAHLGVAGIGREADEGAAAHVFQILMLAQLPLVALFALRSAPAAPKHAAAILGLQIGAAMIAIFPVWWFKL